MARERKTKYMSRRVRQLESETNRRVEPVQRRSRRHFSSPDSRQPTRTNPRHVRVAEWRTSLTSILPPNFLPPFSLPWPCYYRSSISRRRMRIFSLSFLCQWINEGLHIRGHLEAISNDSPFDGPSPRTSGLPFNDLYESSLRMPTLKVSPGQFPT